jgi:hypothetical protein
MQSLWNASQEMDWKAFEVSSSPGLQATLVLQVNGDFNHWLLALSPSYSEHQRNLAAIKACWQSSSLSGKFSQRVPSKVSNGFSYFWQ